MTTVLRRLAGLIRPAGRLTSIACCSLVGLFLSASARGQCTEVVVFEDFEDGAAGWTVTGEWAIGPPPLCPSTCVQGVSAGLRPNLSNGCECDSGPPLNKKCVGSLVSPWIQLPSIGPSDSLELTYCSFMYINYGCAQGEKDCHRLTVQASTGSTTTYLLMGNPYFGAGCLGPYVDPPFDISGFQGQTVQLTWTSACVETDGGQSSMVIDDVLITSITAPPVAYCASLPNSSGNSAQMVAGGCTSVALNAFDLTAVSCPPGQFGLFFFGPNQAQVPFGNGFLCVSGVVERLVPAAVVSPTGVATKMIDFTAPPASGKLVPGSTWNFQFWYRDPAAGSANFNLSDGLSAHFVP